MAVSCPVCESTVSSPRRGRGGIRLDACASCGSWYLDPEAHPYRPASLYNQSYFDPWDMKPGSPAWRLREQTARSRLALLASLGGSGRLLDLGCAGGYLVAAAGDYGFDACGLEISEYAVGVAAQIAPGRVRQGVLETADYADGSFDAVTAFDLVEHHPQPTRLLERIRAILKPNGLFAATVPDLNSLTRRLMGPAWPHFKEEHLFYPTRSGFRGLLSKLGYRLVRESPARKKLSLAFVDPLLRAYPVPVLTSVSARLVRALPRALREGSFTLPIGERLYIARRAA
jgi:SAM-dependent methyltransferase